MKDPLRYLGLDFWISFFISYDGFWSVCDGAFGERISTRADFVCTALLTLVAGAGLRNPIVGTVGLLCVRRDWPCSRRSSNSCNEIASSHWPSQARDHATLGFQIKPSKQKIATTGTGRRFSLRS
jgi:hypothetical protein